MRFRNVAVISVSLFRAFTSSLQEVPSCGSKKKEFCSEGKIYQKTKQTLVDAPIIDSSNASDEDVAAAKDALGQLVTYFGKKCKNCVVDASKEELCALKDPIYQGLHDFVSKELKDEVEPFCPTKQSVCDTKHREECDGEFFQKMSSELDNTSTNGGKDAIQTMTELLSFFLYVCKACVDKDKALLLCEKRKPIVEGIVNNDDRAYEDPVELFCVKLTPSGHGPSKPAQPKPATKSPTAAPKPKTKSPTAAPKPKTKSPTKGPTAKPKKSCRKDSQCGKVGHCSKSRKCEPKQPNGKACAEDDACLSARCDVKKKKCAAKQKNGKTCVDDEDCVTGRCTIFKKCAKKLKNGQFCSDDGDCLSNNCKWSWTGLRCTKKDVPKLPDGAKCLEDEDCKSGTCDMKLKCTSKRGNGKSCKRNSDCASNKCKWSWKGSKCRAKDNEDERELFSGFSQLSRVLHQEVVIRNY